MSFEWMRGRRGRVAAPVREEAAQTSKQPLKISGGRVLAPHRLNSTLAARRTPFVHPLHDGDGNRAQQQDVHKAALSQQHAN